MFHWYLKKTIFELKLLGDIKNIPVKTFKNDNIIIKL